MLWVFILTHYAGYQYVPAVTLEECEHNRAVVLQEGHFEEHRIGKCFKMSQQDWMRWYAYEQSERTP